MKVCTILASAAVFALGTTVSVAMESKPEEPAAPKKEYMEQMGKDADSVIKAIGGSQYDNLLDSFSGNSEASSTLKDARSLLRGGDDTGALAALSKLGNVKMTPGQKELYDELKQNVDVFVMGRNFDTSNPATSGAINNTIAAIRTGDTAKATQGLTELYQKGGLSSDQKQILAELLAQYKGVPVDSIKKMTGDLQNLMK